MSEPRELVLDIERVPGLAEFWQPKTHYINTSSIVSYPRTICFAWKWANERKVHFEAEWHNGHRAMIEKSFELYDEADIVVGYNNRRFDDKHLASDWTEYELGWPSPWSALDLLLVVRRHLGWEVKSLDEVCKRLGLPAKVDKYDPKVAQAAVAGDVRAQRKIAHYNKGDVAITQGVRERLRHLASSPNMAIFYGDNTCRSCGSSDLQKRGFAYTDQSKFQQYRCNVCGAWTRDTKAIERVHTRGAV